MHLPTETKPFELYPRCLLRRGPFRAFITVQPALSGLPCVKHVHEEYTYKPRDGALSAIKFKLAVTLTVATVAVPSPRNLRSVPDR